MPTFLIPFISRKAIGHNRTASHLEKFKSEEQQPCCLAAMKVGGWPLLISTASSFCICISISFFIEMFTLINPFISRQTLGQSGIASQPEKFTDELKRKMET